MSNSIDRLLLNTDTHDEFLKTLMSSLVVSTKASNSLPKGLDYSYSNSFNNYRQVHSKTSDHISNLIESILGFVRPDLLLAGGALSTDISDPYFYDQIVETIDSLLDNADLVLNGSSSSISGANATGSFAATSRQAMVLNKDRIIQENVKSMDKPQLFFENHSSDEQLNEIDNSRDSPFVPKIVTKYHGKQAYEKTAMEHSSDAEMDDNVLGFNHYYPHPYEYELHTLSYPGFVLNDPTNLKPQFPDPLRAFQYVDRKEDLLTVIKELKNVLEIAIDLEHHSVRTFQGLTCLMQISTRAKDYIVDTLALRNDLYRLGEVFADPLKIKVLHGCDRDILWLQRDFGLYIVNCFDTFQAAKTLQFPTLSLAHLVKVYCGVILNKKYQLADWRERPIPEEMMLYAKYDTHYLLYIYDLLRKELWKRFGVEGLENVLTASKKVCMSRYEKEFFDPLGYKALLAISGGTKSLPNINDISPLQENALTKLWDWRDRRAREEDESVQFIMSNAELVRIGVKMPRYEKDVLSCSPLTEYVRSKLSDIAELMVSVSNIGPAKLTMAMGKFPTTSVSKDDAREIVERAKRTIFTFNPTPSQSNKADEVPLSPQLTIDELFRVAGWKTPLVVAAQTSTDKKSSEGVAPPFFEKAKSSHISNESKQRMNKSVDDLFRSLDSSVNFEQRLMELVKIPGSQEMPLPEVVKPTETEECDDILIDEIPKSFEEIYQLSGRNRKKNKDKKRNRDVDASLESEGFLSEKKDAILASVERDHDDSTFVTKDGFDYKQYFDASPDVDTTVDGTLGFAKKIGWVKNDDEMQGLKDEYNKILTYQQSADDSMHPPESQDSRANSELRRSQDKNKLGFTGKTERSIPNKTSLSQDSGDAKAKTSNFLTKSSPAPFDYSKVAQQGMGALPNDDSSKSLKKSAGSKGGSGSGNNKFRIGAVPSNPYLTANKK